MTFLSWAGGAITISTVDNDEKFSVTLWQNDYETDKMILAVSEQVPGPMSAYSAEDVFPVLQR